MKCKVCGKRFVPTVEKLYRAQKTVGTLSTLTTIYDAIDCPRCGCQHALKVRMPKVNMGGGCDD